MFPRTLQGGQPNLRPEVAYGWNYGFVWTPKFLHGLTLSVDYYHIDLRDRTNFIDTQFIVSQNYATRTGLLPNGSPIGGRFADQIVRDPTTGELILIRDLIQNISRTITEGIDYEAINVGDRELEYAGQDTFFGGYLLHNRLYTSAFYDLGGLDTGVTVHYFGQGSEAAAFPATFGLPPRKIREWTTLDAIISYTFNLATPVGENQVAGYAKDGGKSFSIKAGENKNLPPRSTAAYSQCGWRAWVNGTTITAGMNNIFESEPALRRWNV